MSVGTCPTNKKRYPGWTRAAKNLKRLKRQRSHPQEVRVIPCPDCGGFHLTCRRTNKVSP